MPIPTGGPAAPIASGRGGPPSRHPRASCPGGERSRASVFAGLAVRVGQSWADPRAHPHHAAETAFRALRCDAVSPPLHDRPALLQQVVASVGRHRRRALDVRQRELGQQLVHVVVHPRERAYLADARGRINAVSRVVYYHARGESYVWHEVQTTTAVRIP